MEVKSEIFVDNLIFPEGSRWRDERLIFSDVFAQQVLSFDFSGKRETVASIDGLPVGLGWNSSGELLINSLQEKKVLKFSGDEISDYADIGSVEDNFINDMVTDAKGRAYVGTVDLVSFNENIPIGPMNMPKFGSIMLVDNDQSIKRVADRMTFTNGMVITPDGKSLIASETFANRLTIFDIEEDGSLLNRRIFADIGAPTDGVTLDVKGRIWVAVPYYQFGGPGGWVRVEEGGAVSAKIDSNTHGAFDCVLGGPNKDHLFMLEAAILGKKRVKGDGRIKICKIDCPGV